MAWLQLSRHNCSNLYTLNSFLLQNINDMNWLSLMWEVYKLTHFSDHSSMQWLQENITSHFSFLWINEWEREREALSLMVCGLQSQEMLPKCTTTNGLNKSYITQEGKKSWEFVMVRINGFRWWLALRWKLHCSFFLFSWPISNYLRVWAWASKKIPNQKNLS